ncbi:transposase family protein [Streptomyces mirabilis]|uniref:transposase family protein n=1 Tax=Streptomyces mirabilis TaxID=68239 RepID=UPI00210ACC4D|nr:transposase family protein [Streptomyces mirabilis]
MLALTACAVLAGATSLLAVGEWIVDTPSRLLELLGVRPDPLCSKGTCLRKRPYADCWPASTATHLTGPWAAGSPTVAPLRHSHCEDLPSTERAWAAPRGPKAERF